jgi:arylsulfatase A-like enzyme
MSRQAVKNVLLITADQWRGDCLSVLKHACVQTPHLDALAADGVSFRHHYAQAAPCGPSRACLFTGLYMHNHRSVRNGTPLDHRHATLAQEVRALGYEPVLFGYTDTSADPRLYATRDPILTTYEGVLPGMRAVVPSHTEIPYGWRSDLRAKGYAVSRTTPRDIFRPVCQYPGAAQRGATFAPPIYTAADGDTAFLTNAVLTHFAEQPDRPWFIHVSYLRPHPPFITPEPYNTLYDPAQVPPPVRATSAALEAEQHPLLAYYLATMEQQSFFMEGRGKVAALSDHDLRQLRATYYGMLNEVDDQIGRLIAAIKDMGCYDDTLIVFTSDHGEQLGDHWLLGKSGYGDAAFHIPLIIRDPRVQADAGRGRIVTQFTESIDVMPTILECLGATVPVACDGMSLVPFLHHVPPAHWRQEVHFEFDFRDVSGGGPGVALHLKLDQCTLNVIRDHHYKYVHFTALPPLFFDLQEDPAQLHNLATDPAYMPVVLEYAQKLLSWRMQHDERVLTGMHLGASGVTTRQEARW